MRAVAFLLAAVVLAPLPAAAQATRQFWGASVDFVPTWQVPDSFKVLFDASGVTVQGSEFRVGFVRGAILGGDWGVSYVRKNLSDDSLIFRNSGRVVLFPGGTTLDGVEVHKFAAIGTIRQRVQLGADFAVGVGKFKGVIAQIGALPPTIEAQEIFKPGGEAIGVLPLLRVDFIATAILAPDVKIKFAAGLDSPGYTKFSLGAVYLIGAR